MSFLSHSQWLNFDLKVVSNAVRQLQHLVQEDAAQDCWDLYQQEKKAGGTGGPVNLAADRYINELTYQKKAEKMLTDENCFKILIVSGTICMIIH